jgi:hypothetical protein
MFTKIGVTLMVGLAVGLLSAVLAAWRIEQLADPVQLGKRGVDAMRGSLPGSYLGSAMVFAFMAKGVHSWMAIRWPAGHDQYFLLLAVGIAVALTVLAAVALPMMHRRGLAEFTAMHVFYVVGFGWLLPLLAK